MLSTADIPGFFADADQLAWDEYLRVTYHCIPTIDPRLAAAALCAEQSTAMWQRVGSDEDLRPRFGAKVVALEPLPAASAGVWRVVIAHPHRNFGPRLGNLLVALAGEGVFHAPGISHVKLIDIEFPAAYLREFSGPQFGMAGLRARLRIDGRPFFLGVVKPNLGLPVTAFAELAAQAWAGGLDIAKDDEMQADMVDSPLVARVAALAEARVRVEAQDGVPKAFIANITDDADRILTQVGAVTRAGADMVMLNPAWTGLGALAALRRVSELPILGHFAGVAAFTRDPQFGISAALFTKLMRIAGADLIVLPGAGARMHTTEAEMQAGVAACLAPLGSIAPALPIPGGSDWAGTLPSLYERLGHTDFGFIAGRGIFGHPQGPRAGAASIVQAWVAIQAGVPLEHAAREHPELAAALRAFG